MIAGEIYFALKRFLREHPLGTPVMEALLWVVHPDHRRFYCYASPDEATILNETAVLDGGEMLPGFQLPLRNLFRRTSGAHPTA